MKVQQLLNKRNQNRPFGDRTPGGALVASIDAVKISLFQNNMASDYYTDHFTINNTTF